MGLTSFKCPTINKNRRSIYQTTNDEGKLPAGRSAAGSQAEIKDGSGNLFERADHPDADKREKNGGRQRVRNLHLSACQCADETEIVGSRVAVMKLLVQDRADGEHRGGEREDDQTCGHRHPDGAGKATNLWLHTHRTPQSITRVPPAQVRNV